MTRLRKISESAFCLLQEPYVPDGPWRENNRETTTSRIQNFKKPLLLKGEPGWRYKEQAIARFAEDLRGALDPARFASDSVVCPMPPSLTKEEPLYDDRVVQLAKRLVDGTSLAVLELLETFKSRAAAHEGKNRPTEPELRASMRSVAIALPHGCKRVIILDDVYTAGLQFKVAQDMIRNRFPHVLVRGVFLARTERAG